jgi:hypothetical protein
MRASQPLEPPIYAVGTYTVAVNANRCSTGIAYVDSSLNASSKVSPTSRRPSLAPRVRPATRSETVHPTKPLAARCTICSSNRSGARTNLRKRRGRSGDTPWYMRIGLLGPPLNGPSPACAEWLVAVPSPAQLLPYRLAATKAAPGWLGRSGGESCRWISEDPTRGRRAVRIYTYGSTSKLNIIPLSWCSAMWQ